MSNATNPLSPNSYTNKDFQSIYVELLEAAKTLAKGWDPTISNESDPGVVLLKLNAIIGDKNNYNIDKNILENYPETYTQEISARSQYRQMGYKMHWYRAASTTVGFKWVGKDFADGDRLTIKKHTMVMDAAGQYVFTILNDVMLGSMSNSSSLTATVPALQGVITQLKLAGDATITLSNLDSNNRLYINDRYIAENGIFVTSVDDTSGLPWSQVENIELNAPGTKCYEFDIDARRNCPYLQFPDDIRSLIGSGIHVNYIITNGYDGNVSAKTVDSFYSESSVDIIHANGEKESVPLNTDNVLLYNTTGTIDGKDPETISEAYKNFKRVACTFDTLITLRDYMNAIYSIYPEVVSNVIVTDRTNDIQSVYRIVSKDESDLLGYVDHLVGSCTDSNPNKMIKLVDSDVRLYTKRGESEYTDINTSVIENKNNSILKDIYIEVSEDNPELCAFDLKFYLLKNGGILNDISSYNSSFDIDISSRTKSAIDAHLEDRRSLQHDVVDIKPLVPFMLQNVYPIKMKLVPTFKLTEVQKDELIGNIRKCLIRLLNSRQCEFGQEPSYDIIYREIQNCDDRIKVVIMDDFEYTTFAVYLDYDDKNNAVFKYVPISDYSKCSRIIVRDAESCGCADTCDCMANKQTSGTEEAIYSKLDATARRIVGSEVPSDVTHPIYSYLFVDATNGIMYKWSYDKAIENKNDGVLYKYSDKLLDIRATVISRNILAGVTPLFDYDDKGFNITLDMNHVPEMTGQFNNISTNLTIAPFGINTEYTDNNRSATYKLRANESLRFTAPSFITDRTYANYVKFELVLKYPINSFSGYVWANPDDEKEILDKFGRTHFNTRNDSGVYTPIITSGYEKLSTKPRFKLSYYSAKDKGNGLEPTLITNTSCYKILTTKGDFEAAAEATKHIPEYEENVYYAKTQLDSLDGGEGFEVKTSFDSDFYTKNTETGQYNYESYYRLPQYKPGYVSTRVLGLPSIPENSSFYKDILLSGDEEKSIEILDETTLGIVKTYVSQYEYILTNYSSSIYLSNGEKITESKQPLTFDYTYIDEEKNQHSETISCTPRIYYAISNAIMDYDTCEGFYIRSNLINYPSISATPPSVSTDENYEESVRFVKVKRYATDVYKVERDNDGKFVGYTMVEYTDESELVDIYSSDNEYVQAVEPSNWNTLYSDNYMVVYYNGADAKTAKPRAIPSLQKLSIDGVSVWKKNDTNTNYIEVTSDNEPADWAEVYTNYYTKHAFQGLHETSPEYAQWLNGTLSLYIPETSYRLPANTEYQLRDGDYIAFFWRDADESDAPYIYNVYTYDEKNPVIIKSSFTIKASQISDRKVKIDTGNSDHSSPYSGTIPYSGATNDPFQMVQGLMGEYDLSGSRQIEIRKMNSKTLTNEKNRFYYFITAQSTPDTLDKQISYYSMRFDKTRTEGEWTTYRRILDPGEYFIYTNEDKTLFEVLGEGTLVEYAVKSSTTDSITLKVEAINSWDITYKGIDAFYNQCKEVSSSERFKLIEQQIYSFVKDDVININLNDLVRPYYEYTDDTSKATHYMEYQFANCIGAGDELSPVAPKFVPGIYYKCDIANPKFDDYKLLIDCPDDWNSNFSNYYTLASKEMKKYVGGSAETKELYIQNLPNYPVFSTSSPTFLNDCTVSYSSSSVKSDEDDDRIDDRTFVDLPTIYVDNETYGWNVTAHLNLFTDRDEPQKIESESSSDYSIQSVTIGETTYPYKVSSDASDESTDASDKVVDDDKPLYLMSSIFLDKVGSNNIDISYIDLLGKRHPTDIFAYQLNSDCVNSNNGWINTDNGVALKVPAKSESGPGKVDTSIVGMNLDEKFKYLLPVSIPTDSSVTCSFKDGDEKAIECMCCKNTVIGTGKHYIPLSSSMKTLKILAENNGSEDVYIRFERLFKYNYRKIFGGNVGEDGKLAEPMLYNIDTKTILDKIHEIDVPRKFKYDHIPSDDIKIDDPLNPVSMFDSGHVYHDFTIARAELDTSAPHDASVIIVNNR